jgi:hypothetical protein
MKITRRKTKTGCTITVKAETEADTKRLTEAIASGHLAHWLEAAGQCPGSIEMVQVSQMKAPRV